MIYELKIYDALCETKKFTINGIDADDDDFGYSEDASPEIAEPYCCGNRMFYPNQITQEVLDKYRINITEAVEIQNELMLKLSWGECGLCS